MNEEKRARVGDTAETPRKSPRLDRPAAAAAAAAPLTSNGVMGEKKKKNATRDVSDWCWWGKAAALLSGGDRRTRRCRHVLCEQADIDVAITLIKTRVDTPVCCVNKCDDTEGREISVCLDCQLSFCTAHGKPHVFMNDHWIALVYKRPNVAHCFACEECYFIRTDSLGEGMAVGENGFSIGTHKKDEKGMTTVNNEAGVHASMVSDYESALMVALLSDVGTPRCRHDMYNKDEVDLVQRRIMFCDITRMCSDCDNISVLMIFVCLGCEKPFCTVHSSLHAESTKHLVGLVYHNPYVACCFLCSETFVLIGEGDKRMPVDKAAGGYASESVIGHAHAIKGIPNLGNTCYLNSLMQCLLVLGKLRARMLGPDAPSGTLGTALHDLFEQTYSVNNATGLLETSLLLDCVCNLDPQFVGGFMHDNHELLCCLRKNLDEEERMRTPPNMQDSSAGAVPPTVFNSIFGGQLFVTRSCKCCSFCSVSHAVFYDLSVPVPPKKPPAKSVESTPWIEGHRSQPKICINQFEAIHKRNTEKTHRIVEDADSDPASELKDMVMVKTSEPLEVDYTEVEQISQSKDYVQDPQNVLADVKTAGMDATTTDTRIPEYIGPHPPVSQLREENAQLESCNDVGKDGNAILEVSSEHKIDTFSAEVTTEDKGKTCKMIEWTCENCSKGARKSDVTEGTYSEQMLSSTNEDTAVGGYQREQSEKITCQSEQSNKKPECPEGVQDAVPHCVPAERQDNLLSSQDQNATTLDEGRGKQKLHHSAHQVEECQNEQKDRNKGATQTRISKLPLVLTIHLMRSLLGPDKVMGHVSFKEILDMGLFMDPSSEDKDNSIYRLAGVIEHHGRGKDSGHFVAYVRPSPRQQTNGSSSWFCASDTDIREVSLEEVLKCEAYLLFYERMEG
uniref:Ubiquitin carboxyl-terminal hydrolase n=2 Tax=Oryza sativa subsp. japonica TaxID=39947 RepID=Q6ZIC4_ORYSJ|nr:ubiquitin-specific protease-like [Oryza sativa Japonica Group]